MDDRTQRTSLCDDELSQAREEFGHDSALLDAAVASQLRAQLAALDVAGGRRT